MPKTYYVYIATNKNYSVLYVGVTSDLENRMFQHNNKMVDGFTKKYNVNKLIYYDMFNSPDEAISAEKKIKGWTRVKKIDLIKSKNPEFKDLITGLL